MFLESHLDLPGANELNLGEISGKGIFLLIQFEWNYSLFLDFSFKNQLVWHDAVSMKVLWFLAIYLETH